MITTIIFYGNSNGADELCSQTCIAFKVIKFCWLQQLKTFIWHMT